MTNLMSPSDAPDAPPTSMRNLFSVRQFIKEIFIIVVARKCPVLNITHVMFHISHVSALPEKLVDSQMMACILNSQSSAALMIASKSDELRLLL